MINIDSIPLNTVVTQAYHVTDNHGGAVNQTASVCGPEGDHFVINAEVYCGANTIINLAPSADSIDLIAASRSWRQSHMAGVTSRITWPATSILSIRS